MGVGRGIVAVGVAVLLLACPMAASAALIGADVGVGFGSTTAPTLEDPTVSASMLHVGVRMLLRGGLHAGLEFTQSLGTTQGSDSPEGPPAGDRIVTTVALASEWGPAPGRAGGFASLGAGVAHSRLEEARGWYPYFQEGVSTFSQRTLTALGVTAGAGYRLAHKPDRVGFTLAFRGQFMPHSGQIAASAYAVTFGLAY